MNVTEAKLTEMLGYTKSQIKHRRQNHWQLGVEYWYDQGNTVIYNIGAIKEWQQKTKPELEKYEESAKYYGGKTRGKEVKFSTSRTQKLV